VHAVRNDHRHFHYIKAYTAFPINVFTQVGEDTFSEDILGAFAARIVRETLDERINIHDSVSRGLFRIFVGREHKIWVEYGASQAVSEG
jgi:hypothetical protein